MNNITKKLPHLKTALTGPLLFLEKQFLDKQAIIEDWFHNQWNLNFVPVYGSVDLRNAGFKVAPVDMNLFPAGFNNIRLNPEFVRISKEAAKNTILKIVPSAKKILLIPENHTRNTFYWKNIEALIEILSTYFEVRVGSLQIREIQEIQGKETVIRVEPIIRQTDKIVIAKFVPDVILLNNDMSEGIPPELKNLSQPVLPPAELGWSKRLKTEHFNYYKNITKSFSDLVGIDSWLIDPLFKKNEDLNFMEGKGSECLAKNVDVLLKEIQQKYDAYEIKQQPFVVIKANAGTYGMAVMMVKSSEEVLQLNRKQRTQMSKSKGGLVVDSVIVQEGIPTFERFGESQAVAEPVLYMWGEYVVGGFYRLHHDKKQDENLNAPGMVLEPLVFEKPCDEPDASDECLNRFYTYGVIARLSMLAAAKEISDYQGKLL